MESETLYIFARLLKFRLLFKLHETVIKKSEI